MTDLHSHSTGYSDPFVHPDTVHTGTAPNLIPKLSRLLLAVVVGLQTVAVGCAQDRPAGLVIGLDALTEGRYAEARGALRDAMAEQDLEPEAFGETVAAYLETFRAAGEYSAGITEADQLLAADSTGPGAANARYQRGRLLASVGRNAEAEAEFRAAGRLQRNFWLNAIELSYLLENTGQLREARQINRSIFGAFKQGYFVSASEHMVAARAATMLGEFHDANGAHRIASEIDPRNTDNLYWWAELFRSKYNDADARATYSEAIKINESADWLLVGLARAGVGFAQREALAREALAANPNSVGALSLVSSLSLLDGDGQAAEDLARKALDVNPNSVDALAQLAAVQYVAGDTAAYRATADQASSVNPSGSAFYVTVAENLALRFRYPDAIAVNREAVRRTPRDPRALAALGTSLMRAGAFDEARRYLEAAFERDEFNVFVGNTLRLLDEYADFRTLESEHFRLLLHRDEAEVVGPLMLEQAEAAFADMSPRYGYAPEGKILIEAYNDRDDFAVRIAGLPHLGLLGVAFGDVVALNTPRALGGQPYNWARTLRHELAHTMAIGVSGFRVPRWFTEGLSVYEEKRVRPDWAREMDLELFAAMERDKLHSLSAMDRGFTRPEFPGQVLLSYYHASKIVEHIVNEYGFDAIVGVLERLRGGSGIAAAISDATGREFEALDDEIATALEAYRSGVSKELEGLPDVLAVDNTDASAMSGAEANKLSTALRRGHELLSEGEQADAMRQFRNALAVYPDYVGPGNAYQALARIYRDQNDEEELADVLESYLEVSDYGAAEARELAGLYVSRGQLGRASGLLKRSLEVDPYDREARADLATYLAALGQTELAVTERRAVLALQPVDRAEALYQLASALHLNKESVQAKRATLEALEIAPGYREAQRLLLSIVEGGR